MFQFKSLVCSHVRCPVSYLCAPCWPFLFYRAGGLLYMTAPPDPFSNTGEGASGGGEQCGAEGSATTLVRWGQVK